MCLLDFTLFVPLGFDASSQAIKDRDRYKSELRRFRDGGDSDGSRGMESEFSNDLSSSIHLFTLY